MSWNMSPQWLDHTIKHIVKFHNSLTFSTHLPWVNLQVMADFPTPPAPITISFTELEDIFLRIIRHSDYLHNINMKWLKWSKHRDPQNYGYITRVFYNFTTKHQYSRYTMKRILILPLFKRD